MRPQILPFRRAEFRQVASDGVVLTIELTIPFAPEPNCAGGLRVFEEGHQSYRRNTRNRVSRLAYSTRLSMMPWMTTESEIKEFASQWVAAWNSHDLDAIMSHYGGDVVLISPVAAKILDNPSGTVEGDAALRNYFKRGLELYPNLHFELLDVMCGLSSIVVCYKNQKGTRTAEFMEFGKNGKIIRVVANYSG